MMLDFMDLSVDTWNSNVKYAYKKTMQKCWIKYEILPPEMISELRNPISNNESVNTNDATHDEISQDTYDADNMDFSGDKEATIAASDIYS